MDTLKMRFKLHNLEFEVEGNETIVKEQFENFKTFITGELLSKINIQNTPITVLKNLDEPQAKNKTRDFEDTEIVNDSKHPDITNIIRRKLAGPEWEWVLVYAF